ncbi:hypothetical protein F4823DRAFT_565180 [Ustulina deusta]|nr:hypothetical protein F4823DRAFT_565180 [Ustulina deusta]
MLLLPHPTHKPRCFAPGSSPATAGRRHRKGLKTQHMQASPYVRKGNQVKPRQATHRRKAHTFRIGWDRDERDDGRRLASDPTVALPGEGRRPTPRLERQEAFRAPQAWDNVVVVDDDAALYRLGILYDSDDENAHVRESGFCLDAIVRAEPVYSLRPAKRRKRIHDPELKEEDLHLSVNLLSTYLAEDAAIARFLAPMRDEEPARLDSIAGEGLAESLAIIHELIVGSTHSPAPTTAASYFPDLVSDTEEEGGEEYEGSGDWALVSDPSADAAWIDTDIDVVTDDGEAANPVDGVWVFIAGDDS